MSKINYDEIERQASEFRQTNFMNQDEPIGCKGLLLTLNVQTFYRPLSEDLSGISMKVQGMNFMIVNSEHSRGRQHFTIAHELYHLFIQKDFEPHCYNSKAGKTETEKKADVFASRLLLPESGVKRMIPLHELSNKDVSLGTLLKLEHYFSVSHVAMLNRLKGLNLIKTPNYDTWNDLFIKKVAQEYGYSLSLYEKGNENVLIGDYGTLAKNLFDKQKISESHYRSLMAEVGIVLGEEDGDEES